METERLKTGEEVVAAVFGSEEKFKEWCKERIARLGRYGLRRDDRVLCLLIPDAKVEVSDGGIFVPEVADRLKLRLVDYIVPLYLGPDTNELCIEVTQRGAATHLDDSIGIVHTDDILLKDTSWITRLE